MGLQLLMSDLSSYLKSAVTLPVKFLKKKIDNKNEVILTEEINRKKRKKKVSCFQSR